MQNRLNVILMLFLVVALVVAGASYLSANGMLDLGSLRSQLGFAPADTSGLSQLVVQEETTPPADMNIITQTDEVVEPVADFPVYPGASLLESSQRIINLHSNQDVRAKWKVSGPVPAIMSWYLAELPKSGWVIDIQPNDRAAKAEQVANISRGNLSGYVAVEDEGEYVEIMIDFKQL